MSRDSEYSDVFLAAQKARHRADRWALEAEELEHCLRFLRSGGSLTEWRDLHGGVPEFLATQTNRSAS